MLFWLSIFRSTIFDISFRTNIHRSSTIFLDIIFFWKDCCYVDTTRPFNIGSTVFVRFSLWGLHVIGLMVVCLVKSYDRNLQKSLLELIFVAIYISYYHMRTCYSMSFYFFHDMVIWLNGNLINCAKVKYQNTPPLF